MPDNETLTPAEPTQTEQALEVEALPALEPTSEEPVQADPVEEATEETVEQPDLPEGWQEHAETKTLLETARKDSHAEGYQKGQSDTAKSKDSELRDQRISAEDSKQQAIKTVMAGEVVGNASKAVESFLLKLETDQSFTTAEANQELRKILNDNKEFAAAFDASAHIESIEVGKRQGMMDASRFIQSGLTKELTTQMSEAIAEINKDIRDPQTSTTWEQGFALGLQKRDELVRADEATKLEKLASERTGKETKAQERDGQKSAANTNGRGSAGASKGKYTTLIEARTAHAAGEISNEEMREAKLRFRS